VPWETVTITTLSRDRDLFLKLLSEARDLAMLGHEGKLLVHIPDSTRWRPFGQPRRKRPLKSVVLDDSVAQKVEHDIRTFLDRRQWYANRGKVGSLPTLSRAKSTARHSVPARLFAVWSPWIWEIFFYSSHCWGAELRYLYIEPL
jgi:hypothetical protein